MWIHLELDSEDNPLGELTDDDGEVFAVLRNMEMNRDLHTVNDGSGTVKYVPGEATISLHFSVTDDERCRDAVRFDKKPA